MKLRVTATARRRGSFAGTSLCTSRSAWTNAKPVLTEAELAGAVGDDHCSLQQAARLDRTPERALGSDPNRLGRGRQPVDAELRLFQRKGYLFIAIPGLPHRPVQ